MLKGYRFRRELEVLPWLRFNLSKTGVSATIGPDDVHVTVGKGDPEIYVDMPGKGTYFRRQLDEVLEDVGLRSDDENATKNQQHNDDEQTEEENAQLIEYGFVERLFTRPSELAFANALQALLPHEQMGHFLQASLPFSIRNGMSVLSFMRKKGRRRVLTKSLRKSMRLLRNWKTSPNV